MAVIGPFFGELFPNLETCLGQFDLRSWLGDEASDSLLELMHMMGYGFSFVSWYCWSSIILVLVVEGVEELLLL